jgi:hypothetical protein
VADKLNAIYEPISIKLYEPRCLTTLWGSTACYSDTFSILCQWSWFLILSNLSYPWSVQCITDSVSVRAPLEGTYWVCCIIQLTACRLYPPALTSFQFLTTLAKVLIRRERIIIIIIIISSIINMSEEPAHPLDTAEV